MSVSGPLGLDLDLFKTLPSFDGDDADRLGAFGERFFDLMALQAGWDADLWTGKDVGVDRVVLFAESADQFRFQIKTTMHPNLDNSRTNVRSQLKKRTIESLAPGPVAVKGFLVIFVLGADFPGWIDHGAEASTIPMVGYWGAVTSGMVPEKSRTKLIQAPLENRFDYSTMKALEPKGTMS